jgi:phosphoribosylanthranilate isomerase
MQLKISSITNLTDARFFSAIGAHYLGFCLDVLNEYNISIPKAKEIISWLHEPVIVGEFGIHQSKEEIEYAAKELSMSDIQIPYSHPQREELAFEKFLQIDVNDLSVIGSRQPADFVILKLHPEDLSNQTVRDFISKHKVFIEAGFSKENILPITGSLRPYGIQISCRKEEKTGWSAVDEYADILELIGFS